MRKIPKKSVGFFKFLFQATWFLIVCCVLSATLSLAPMYLAKNLQDIDEKSFMICQDVTQSKFFTKGKVEFLVDKSARSSAYVFSHENFFFKFFFKNKIFLHPKILKENRDILRVTVAHELGHIEYETLDQVRADHFAVLIFGEEAVLKLLLHFEKKYPNIDIDDMNKRKAALKKK